MGVRVTRFARSNTSGETFGTSEELVLVPPFTIQCGQTVLGEQAGFPATVAASLGPIMTKILRLVVAPCALLASLVPLVLGCAGPTDPFNCRANEVLINGVCTERPADFKCDDTQIMVDGDCVNCSASQVAIDNVCVERARCSKTQIVVNNTCQDCEEGQVAQNNVCKDANDVPSIEDCAEGEVLLDNECAEACRADQIDVDGVCTDCDDGMVVEDGECVVE